MTSNNVRCMSVLMLLATFLQSSIGFNILLFPTYTTTHQVLFEALETQLRLGGHNVSYLLYEEDLGLRRPPSQAILIETPPRGPIAGEELQDWEMRAMSGWTPTVAKMPASYFDALASRCQLILESDDLLRRLGEAHYHLLLIDLWGNDLCGLALGKKLNVLVGGILTSMSEPFSYYAATSFLPSYIPISLTTHDPHPNFAQRINHLYSYLTQSQNWEDTYVRPMYRAVERHVPSHRAASDFYRDLAIVFVNTFTALDLPTRPVSPNTFFIGGIHCRVPSLLPKDIDDIARAHRRGIFLLHLVSVRGIGHYPADIVQKFLDGLGALPHAIFWKAENESLPVNLPSNIFVDPLFPVQDIMGHARTRLVISFCDRDTVIAAIYHHVPLLCIPVLEDQVDLARTIHSKAIGVMLPLDKLNASSLKEAALAIVNNNSFHLNARHYSGLLRDQPDTPNDRLLFWTEYVIRRNGAQHLRNHHLKLQVWEYFFVDVILVLLVVLLAFLFAIACITLMIRKLFLNKSIPKKKAE